MNGDDLIFQAMDLPNTNLFINDMDVPSTAIPINTCGAHIWDVSEIFPDLAKQDKLLSTSPNTFVTSEYAAPQHNAASHQHQSGCGNVQLRNHDCMWSGRCNMPEIHTKKLKAQAAQIHYHNQSSSNQNQKALSRQDSLTNLTPAQSPSKGGRTIQAGQSLLRFKQPSKSDENNNSNSSHRPDTPQSLGGSESESPLDTSCTTTGSNHLPLLSAKENEMARIKEYLLSGESSAKGAYKAFDNTTTLADVMTTLEGGDSAGQSTYPMSPAEEEEDCTSNSSTANSCPRTTSGQQMMMGDDDTESEREMDEEEGEEFSLHDDDEGISLKMMPTSHLSSNRGLYEMGRMLQQHFGHQRRSLHDDVEDEDDDEETSEEEEEEEEVNGLMFSGATGEHLELEEEEEDSGTERSLYGSTQLTAQEKTLMMQQSSMHSDHCYTRVTSRVDTKNLGVDTPSDSGECHLKKIFGKLRKKFMELSSMLLKKGKVKSAWRVFRCEIGARHAFPAF